MIRSTPLWMAFGLEEIIPIEIQIPSLRVQVTKRLDEEQSERIRKPQLLEFEESRLQSMCHFEHKQRKTKAFVDRHK